MPPEDVTGRYLSKLAALIAVEEHFEVDEAHSGGAAMELQWFEDGGDCAATQCGVCKMKV